jgi:hypothetical protein
LCCGHEDLNDHDRLREDVLMQTALGRVDALASSPTLSRMETRATRGQIWALHEVLVEQFIASHAGEPHTGFGGRTAAAVPYPYSRRASTRRRPVMRNVETKGPLHRPVISGV